MRIAWARNPHLDSHLRRLPQDREKRQRIICIGVYEQGDWEAAGNLLRIFGHADWNFGQQDARRPQGALHRHSGYPPVGTADQIAVELCKLADIGVAGCLISWVDYKNELKQWNAEVLPLLEQAGLRQPFRSVHRMPATDAA